MQFTKNPQNSLRKMRWYFPVWATVLLIAGVWAGCSSTGQSSGPSEIEFDTSSLLEGYEFFIHEGDSKAAPLIMFVDGWGAETNWKEGLNLVFLNTHDTNEPLGTLTLTINQTLSPIAVSSVLCSTTRVRVGTGPELDGQSYSIPFPGGRAGKLKAFGCSNQDIENECNLEEIHFSIDEVILSPERLITGFEASVVNNDTDVEHFIHGRIVARKSAPPQP